MSGVNCGIDAIGFQARDRANPNREKPDQVIHDLARLINPTGRLGIVGVEAVDHPGEVDLHQRELRRVTVEPDLSRVLPEDAATTPGDRAFLMRSV